MDPELEILEASFNSRIEQWISKQGLLFQFTHKTGFSSLFPKLCGLVFRLLILALIGLAVFWFYLTSRPESEAFKDDVQQQIAIGLNANDVEISNISRDKGNLLTAGMLFSALSLGESKSSFFEDWHVMEEDVSVVGRRSVIDRKKTATFQDVNVFPMGIGDNYFSGSGWSAQEINILKMELKLKTGADTDAEAEAAYASLFKSYDTLKINTIQVFDATIHWGDSELSAGSIKGAQLDITKGDDSWVMNVTGGFFSHNWLKNAAINKMKVICKSSGEVVIESASLSLGEGMLSFDASILIKAQPELTGNYSFNGVEVTDLIGSSYADWLDGRINGTGILSGKLNSEEDIKVTTTVKLTSKTKRIDRDYDTPKKIDDEKDSVLIIRGDSFQLLKLMQMKNPRNSYALLRAHKGTLIIESQGHDTQVTVDDVRCGLHDLILLRGKFDYAMRIRKSKEKEIEIDTSSLEYRKQEEKLEGEVMLDPFLDQNIVTERAFSGRLKLGLVPEVFENNTKVLEAYPIDNKTLRVWFDIELKGQLEELTEELADKLYYIMKDEENK